MTKTLPSSKLIAVLGYTFPAELRRILKFRNDARPILRRKAAACSTHDEKVPVAMNYSEGANEIGRSDPIRTIVKHDCFFVSCSNSGYTRSLLPRKYTLRV